MNLLNTPLSLLGFLQFLILTSAQAPPVPTLAPPSTFPTLSGSSTSPTSSGSTQSANSTSSPPASATNSAQFPSLSGYSPCVSNCLAVGIARVNCSSITEVDCFCVNPQFPLELLGCVNSNCPTEAATLENLAQQFCNIASSSPSLSFPPITTGTSSSTTSPSSTPTSPSTTPPPSNTSAATPLTASLANGMSIALVVGFVGLVLGAYTHTV